MFLYRLINLQHWVEKEKHAEIFKKVEKSKFWNFTFVIIQNIQLFYEINIRLQGSQQVDTFWHYENYFIDEISFFFLSAILLDCEYIHIIPFLAFIRLFKGKYECIGNLQSRLARKTFGISTLRVFIFVNNVVCWFASECESGGRRRLRACKNYHLLPINDALLAELWGERKWKRNRGDVFVSQNWVFVLLRREEQVFISKVYLC